MSRLTPREQKLFLLLGILIVLGISLRFVFTGSKGKTPPSPASSAQDDPPLELITSNEIETVDEVIVHVAGGVHNPGVYYLPEGSRVFEAVNSAGGALEPELLDKINLAQPVYDGQKIVVPATANNSQGEAAYSESINTEPGLININLAGSKELEQIPGIGPVRAGDIIEYREKNGPFRSTQELTLVRGIGEKTFEGIKDYITIY